MAQEVESAPKGFVERVAEQASTVTPWRVLVTLLTLPFYVLGWLLGILWVAVLFVAGAVKVGFADARARTPQRPPAGGDG